MLFFLKRNILQKPDVGDEELPEREASPVHQSAESEDDEEEVAPAKAKAQIVRNIFMKNCFVIQDFRMMKVNQVTFRGMKVMMNPPIVQSMLMHPMKNFTKNF